MSTKLTKTQLPMIESKTLQLVFAAARAQDEISRYLSATLTKQGYVSATPATLNFLSTLECGVNYGSEIARTLGVSRQQVAKTVRHFCQLGYLEQVESTGKQKKIIFTRSGEQLMSDSRRLLAELDGIIAEELGDAILAATETGLKDIQGVVAQKSAI